MGYVEWSFGGIFRLTVPVSSHNISKVGIGADLSHDSVDNIDILAPSFVSVGLYIRTELLLAGIFIRVGWFIVAMPP